MNKSGVFLLASVILFVSCCLVFADTLILKSGAIVKGKITQDSGEYLIVEVSGIPVTYWKDEIKKIEKDDAAGMAGPEMASGEKSAAEYFKVASDAIIKKNYQDAANNAEKAIAADKNYLPAYAVLEASYYRLNKFKELVEVSTQAVSLVPADLNANIYLALGYKNTGQKEEARKYFSRVVYLMGTDNRAVTILVEDLLKDLGYDITQPKNE
ncbi:MAG: tetratricopeptide repeat protein [Desulfocucumaceae bacterium]